MKGNWWAAFVIALRYCFENLLLDPNQLFLIQTNNMVVGYFFLIFGIHVNEWKHSSINLLGWKSILQEKGTDKSQKPQKKRCEKLRAKHWKKSRPFYFLTIFFWLPFHENLFLHSIKLNISLFSILFSFCMPFVFHFYFIAVNGLQILLRNDE